MQNIHIFLTGVADSDIAVIRYIQRVLQSSELWIC